MDSKKNSLMALGVAVCIPILLETLSSRISGGNEAAIPWVAMGVIITAFLVHLVDHMRASRHTRTKSDMEEEREILLSNFIEPTKDDHGASNDSSSSASTDASTTMLHSTATPPRILNGQSYSSEMSMASSSISTEEEALWARCFQTLTETQKQWLDGDLKFRFIKGSAYITNMKKREQYLKKRLVGTCEFREKYRVDTILNRDHPFMTQFRDDCWRMRIFGTDEKGNPIVYVRLSDHRYRNIKDAPYKLLLLEYLTVHQEALLRAVSRRSTRQVQGIQPQYTAIFDLEGVGWRMFKDAYDCGFFSEVADLWAVNYPETLRRIYVINAPFIITALLSVVSPLIEPDTLLKLRIVGRSFLPLFRTDKVPLTSLPLEIGGTCQGTFILPPENPKLDLTK